MKFLQIFFAILIAWILQISVASGENIQSPAFLLKIKGAIGPATQDFIHKEINQAIVEKAPAIIFQLDTPGGLSDSMREIIQDILASPIPIITYVAPSGARAASAGTFIVYASHLAAMAPGTNIGAASPVSVGMPGKDSENQKKEKLSTEELKAKQDAQAYIRSLAELRGRNVEWAEQAVSKAASLTAQQALQQKVIDIIADNINDLLLKANGKNVQVQGKIQILQSQAWTIKEIKPNWRIRLLTTITNPSVAYILLIVGVYGLFFEFMNPGFIMPGVAGIIALLLALYAFQLLPIDYAGLALIIVGLGFIIAEIFVPAFGALGIGGAIAFLTGSIMLLKPGGEGFNLPIQLIIAMTVITVLFFLGIIAVAIRARRAPIVSGREGMIGQIGEVVIDHNEIWVHIMGERWRAICDQELKSGQKIKVTGVQDLKLLVTPLESNK